MTASYHWNTDWHPVWFQEGTQHSWSNLGDSSDSGKSKRVPNPSVSLFCWLLQGIWLSELHSPGCHPEIVWGAPSGGGHHSGDIHWHRVPRQNSRQCIRRLPGKEGCEAGLWVVPTAVQLCDGQDSEGSNWSAWRCLHIEYTSSGGLFLSYRSITTASTSIQNVVHTDDLTLVAETRRELQHMLDINWT